VSVQSYACRMLVSAEHRLPQRHRPPCVGVVFWWPSIVTSAPSLTSTAHALLQADAPAVASSADSRPLGSSRATYSVKCEIRWPISPPPITSLHSSPVVVVLLCHDTRAGASSVPYVRAGEVSFRLYHFINRYLCYVIEYACMCMSFV
jgi:hypothetical protein